MIVSTPLPLHGHIILHTHTRSCWCSRFRSTLLTYRKPLPAVDRPYPIGGRVEPGQLLIKATERYKHINGRSGHLLRLWAPRGACLFEDSWEHHYGNACMYLHSVLFCRGPRAFRSHKMMRFSKINYFFFGGMSQRSSVFILLSLPFEPCQSTRTLFTVCDGANFQQPLMRERRWVSIQQRSEFCYRHRSTTGLVKALLQERLSVCIQDGTLRTKEQQQFCDGIPNFLTQLKPSVKYTLED